MNTVERIKNICKERKIPISRLEADLEFGNGYIRSLRKGVVPDDRLLAISRYLNLSVEYLATGNEPSFDFIYSDGDMEFIVEFTRRANSDKRFLERMMKYMELLNQGNTVVDEMIDFQYEKQKKAED